MSTSVRERPEERGVDLGTEVSWPLVLTAGGLGVLVLGTGIVLAVVAALRPPPAPDPVLAQQGRRFHLPELSDPPLRPRVSRPVEAVEPEPPELLPRPAIVAPQPAPPTPAFVAHAPVPAEPVKVVAAPPVPGFKWRSRYSEAQLLLALDREAREVDIESEKGPTTKLLEQLKKAAGVNAKEGSADKDSKKPPTLELIAQRDDLKGLPVRNLADCQVEAKNAKAMKEVSTKLRDCLPYLGKIPDYNYEEKSHQSGFAATFAKCLKSSQCPDELGVRLVVQMLQAENYPARLLVVNILEGTKAKSAGAALAQRAVFDLNATVREAAVKALKARPGAEYRPVLLQALRYPWTPVADHAAEALVALGDCESATDLVDLLDLPDPQAPIQDVDKKWVVPKLVRMNHLRNCLLCHAPSSARNDPIRGLVPEHGEPLTEVYSDSTSGKFVRADVTYLMQDFSVTQPVAEPGKWPQMQRFDYLIQKRELSADETTRLTHEKKATYPQREAVLWALRELTGEDAGDKSEDWYLLLMEQSLWRTD